MKIMLQKIGSGFLFGIGFVLFVLLVDYIKAEMREREDAASRIDIAAEREVAREEEQQLYLDAEKVVIKKSRVIRLGSVITISFEVQNQLETPFGSASLSAQLFDEIGLVGECRGSLSEFESKEVREHLIDCYSVLSDLLPKNATHKVTVEQVYK